MEQLIGEAVREATASLMREYNAEEQDVKDSTLLSLEEMTQDQRERAFRHLQEISVEDTLFQDDWRSAILVEIAEIDFVWWSDLVEYFTATRLVRWTGDYDRRVEPGKVVAYAVGYRMGPAGP